MLVLSTSTIFILWVGLIFIYFLYIILVKWIFSSIIKSNSYKLNHLASMAYFFVIIFPILYLFSDDIVKGFQKNYQRNVEITDNSKKPNEIIPVEYDFFRQYADNYVIVHHDGLEGVVDTNNRAITVPVKYLSLNTFSGDIVIAKMQVKNTHRYGLINFKKGDIVLPIKYSYISRPVNGIAEFRLGFKYGKVNKYGKIVKPLQ